MTEILIITFDSEIYKMGVVINRKRMEWSNQLECFNLLSGSQYQALSLISKLFANLHAQWI